LFHVAKTENLHGGAHFQTLVDIQRNVLIVLLEKFFSNISRYSKDIQIKGIA
jgi:hypothetical protein